jgi:hypothetical protein
MAVAGSPNRGGGNPSRYFDDLRRVPGEDTRNLDILRIDSRAVLEQDERQLP